MRMLLARQLWSKAAAVVDDEAQHKIVASTGASSGVDAQLK